MSTGVNSHSQMPSDAKAINFASAKNMGGIHLRNEQFDAQHTANTLLQASTTPYRSFVGHPGSLSQSTAKRQRGSQSYLLRGRRRENIRDTRNSHFFHGV